MMVSERYAKEVEDLRAWFMERLPVCGSISLTTDQYKAGCDSLAGLHHDLVRASSTEWLTKRRYELSYNQTCCAFFGAAKALNLLIVDGQQPTAPPTGE